MNRLGVVDTQTPEQTDRELDRIFDTETKRVIHHPLVLFGRYRCIAQRPKCESCQLQTECKYYKNIKKGSLSPKS